MSRSRKIHLVLPATCLLAAVLLHWSRSDVFGQRPTPRANETIAAEQPPAAENVPDLNQVAEAMVQLTSVLRKSEGLSTIRVDPKLQEVADYFARFMATHDKYGHTADGKRPAERATAYGYDYCIILENIGFQSQLKGFAANELARSFVEGWGNSPEHRKNMLDADITEAGMSIARSAKKGHYYAVQVFGRPRSDAIRFEVENRSSLTVHYKIDEQSFVLEPRFTRMHELCSRTELQFYGTNPDREEPESTVLPRHGEAFSVTSNGAGSVSIQREKTRR